MDSERFDRWTRILSRRTAVGGGLGALLAVAARWELAGAKPPACSPQQKRCGARCIPKRACCPRTQRRCGNRCVPKRSCCPGTEKRCGTSCVPASACCPGTKPCGGACIPATQCCVDAECGAFKICARGQCVIGQGTCSATANYCTRTGSTNCSVGASGCSCYQSTTGASRCGAANFLSPPTPCVNDVECAGAYPNIPGVFCMNGGGGINCGFTGGRCHAPCPG